jgi:flagellin-like protein
MNDMVGRKMKRIGDRKALSPIFASLLILAIVTVLFIPVYFWSTGLTVETRDFWDRSSLIVTERIVIEEVNLKGGVSSCTIYVRNIGSPAIIIDDVFISLGSYTLYTYGKTQFTTDSPSVVQGDLITISITDPGFTPESGQTYTVKVYTTRGVGDVYQVMA